MAGIRRVSDLGTKGWSNILDGSIVTADLANSSVTTAKIADNNITQAKLDTNMPLSGFRNFIINGDFTVNQRGLTSGGTTTQLYSGYDRWLWVATGGTVTYSAQSFSTGNAISGYEPKNFARLAISGQASSGDFCLFAQKIENVRVFAGQQVTLSFWAKSTTGTPSISIELDQSFGAGGSSSVQTYITKIPITTSWARYTATFTVPSISGKTVGSGTDSYLGINLWYSAGSGLNARTGSLGIQNNTFDIWGVQLEQGSQPTPFEQRPYGLELQLCQRYYEAVVHTHANRNLTLGYLSFYNVSRLGVRFLVQKRAAPDQLTVTALNVWVAGASSITSPTPNVLQITETGFAAEQSGNLTTCDTVQYKASAEL